MQQVPLTPALHSPTPPPYVGQPSTHSLLMRQPNMLQPISHLYQSIEPSKLNQGLTIIAGLASLSVFQSTTQSVTNSKA